MRNPWKELKSNILKSDIEHIEEHNKIRKNTDYEIKTTLLPEPFMGNKEAPIVLLNLNPGFDDKDVDTHKREEFIAIIKKNLTHSIEEKPFYLLNDKFKSPGYSYWKKRLKEVIEECGIEKVSENIQLIEFFPYHSKKYKDLPLYKEKTLLESQKYSFFLVEEAIKRGVLIIIMRAVKKWTKEVPGLIKHKKTYYLNSPQSGYVSKNNIYKFHSPNGFGKIVHKINK